MNNTRLILVSFADKRYRKALERLDEWTRAFPFTERHFHTEDDIFDRKYWHDLKPWLYRRGYGYWNWKARMIRHYMESMDDGDIIFYCDAGVYWNSTPQVLKRFAEYVEMLTRGGVLSFQEPYKESDWTKGDIFDAVGVYDDDKICSSLQLWTGCIGIKKTVATTKFVEKWQKLNSIDRELVTDKRSVKTNKEGFKENRHDQSTFSVLVKTYPHIEISHTETQPADKDWSKLDNFPIQARRHKEQGRPLSVRLYNKLLRPWRMILYVYFTRCRDYYFLGGNYPW